MPLIVSLVLAALATACGPESSARPTQAAVRTPVPSPDAQPPALWIAAGVPDALRQAAESSGIRIASNEADASMILGPNETATAAGITWIYALAAPFPTVLDEISSSELQAVWAGTTFQYSSWPLYMAGSTANALQHLWGAPGPMVEVVDSEMILDTAWAERPSLAILPFEELEPRWKVLSIDDQSPIRKDFDASGYPLALGFRLRGASGNRPGLELPATNREPSRLTTVLMSGTSGLVRELAYQMEVHGITYPASDIGDWLRDADVFHISHEASFDPACPPPNPLKSRFSCSSPKYIGLFDDVGLDVVELTGNHIMDNGSAAMLYSLDLYREHGISYYGGGANLDDARQPLRMEHNGNRFAFLGCNFAEPPQPLATSNLPGANPCDWKDLSIQVSDLRNQGVIPIVTLQYKEGYSPVVMPWQSIDFRRAADAGAAIVSGSQSHVPMQMEFYEGAFIHYGLGNLFFGQMANQPPGPGLPLQPAQRYEFLDRHVLYAGRHISTELLTAMLEDYARPRPMTADERTAILESYFAYSGWLPFIPTPSPAKTPTPYPLLKFVPLPTYTPLPRSTSTPGG